MFSKAHSLWFWVTNKIYFPNDSSSSHLLQHQVILVSHKVHLPWNAFTEFFPLLLILFRLVSVKWIDNLHILEPSFWMRGLIPRSFINFQLGETSNCNLPLDPPISSYLLSILFLLEVFQYKLTMYQQYKLTTKKYLFASTNLESPTFFLILNLPTYNDYDDQP